jgi:hypothetical protein
MIIFSTTRAGDQKIEVFNFLIKNNGGNGKNKVVDNVIPDSQRAETGQSIELGQRKLL